MTMHITEKPLPKIIRLLLQLSCTQVTVLQHIRDQKGRPAEATFFSGRYVPAAGDLRDSGLIYLSHMDREHPGWLLTPDGQAAIERIQKFIDSVEAQCTK